MNKPKFAARILAASLALTGLAACDFNFVPEMADGAGEQTARISVSLASANETALAADISNVKLEIIDVLVHNAENDDWYILNEDTYKLSLPHSNRNIVFEDVPVPAGEYDAVMVVVQSAEVAAKGGMRHVELVRDVVEIDEAMLLDRDGTLDLRFDLDGSIQGSFEAGYTMNPMVLLTAP